MTHRLTDITEIVKSATRDMKRTSFFDNPAWGWCCWSSIWFGMIWPSFSFAGVPTSSFLFFNCPLLSPAANKNGFPMMSMIEGCWRERKGKNILYPAWSYFTIGEEWKEWKGENCMYRTDYCWEPTFSCVSYRIFFPCFNMSQPLHLFMPLRRRFWFLLFVS